MKYTKEQVERSEEYLRTLITPGTIIYTGLQHVSASGMMREIKVYVMKDNEPIHISYSVACVLGYSQGKSDGIRVAGCGMDMGYHIMMSISYHFFRGGFECIGKGCPSNDHSNGDRNYEPHHHESGGYALSHRWL
jgi:hypothetical protein